ncbi:MAG: WecB/TagA/CpsF family glycosyltransferase [Chloroflexota bacterium]
MREKRRARRVDILGVEIDALTPQEAHIEIARLVRAGTGHQVVTVNPEFVMAARRDREFADVLRHADLALADGMGLLWASRILGCPLRERVAGVEVVLGLAALCAQQGFSLFLLGSAPGVAEEAARVLQEANPGLKIAGTFPGSPRAEEEDMICDLIRKARPSILLVAFGAPQQDKWIRRHLSRTGVPVAMGVGGAFDFISGRARRAPGWMRRIGLEWLYRLCRQPWRWRRMLALPQFAWLVWRARLTGKNSLQDC